MCCGPSRGVIVSSGDSSHCYELCVLLLPGQASAMSAEQLLQLAQSMAEKRLAKQGSDEGYEAVMLYISTLAVCSAKPSTLVHSVEAE